MTELTTDQLSERVALALGVCWHPADKIIRSYGNWGCDNTCGVCGKDTYGPIYNPSDPRELFALMVKYDVWPKCHEYEPRWVRNGVLGHIEFEILSRSPSVHFWETYTDEASKLEAATRVILRGVLLKIEGGKK